MPDAPNASARFRSAARLLAMRHQRVARVPRVLLAAADGAGPGASPPRPGGAGGGWDLHLYRLAHLVERVLRFTRRAWQRSAQRSAVRIVRAGGALLVERVNEKHAEQLLTNLTRLI